MSTTTAKPRKNRLSRLPRWISHWLGYRDAPSKPEPAYAVYLWSFTGSFCGLAVIQAVLYYAPTFAERHVVFVASFAASAVLCYGSIHLPLAQPRNLIGGHLIAAIIGVCILKLFLLLPPGRFNDLLWLSSSLAAALTIVAMQATQTTHPPAGATALIPIVDEGLRSLGWYYIPVVLLSSALVLGTALLLNNIQRRYPVYWISPNVAAPPAAAAPANTNSAEKGDSGMSRTDSRVSAMPHPNDPDALEDIEKEAEKEDMEDWDNETLRGSAPAPAPAPAPVIGTISVVRQSDPRSDTARTQNPSANPVLRLDEFAGWYKNWNHAAGTHS